MLTRQGRSHIGLMTRRALVDVLVVAGFADDKSIRTLMVAELRRALDNPFTVPDQLDARTQLIEIVNGCCVLEDGLPVLADVLEFLRPGTKECAEFRALVDSLPLRDVVSDTDQERIRRLLDGFSPPGLRTAVRRAARHISPVPQYADAAEAFFGLADFNAAPGELPPVVAFAELLAAECEERLAAQLHEWADGQAHRLLLDDALRELRNHVVPPASGPLHLTIVISPDLVDEDRYEISHWRQDHAGEWPPPRGESVTATSAALEDEVARLISAAEEAWAESDAEVLLEFVLPRALLDLPVHTWSTERDFGVPQPLYLAYPTVIRSLERMSSRRSHRVWRRRWASWSREPSCERVYFCDRGDTEDRHHLDAILSDEKWLMTVLTESPPPEPEPGRDEFFAALRAGLPVIVWHPTASSEVVREVVMWMAGDGGLGNLPALTRKHRLDALRNRSSSPDGDVIGDLVVLWDDPNRMLPLGDGGTGPAGGGGADERDRAS
ncbi:effector-associated domain 2-containing protein [Amycolatopsis sp. cmx-4-61]|uniref:VMAP-C domain-containing protein n=1 Tax=Amycolatopsis sp. cmx-4-61 TaxID=2790937 RepID=UPI0039796266